VGLAPAQSSRDNYAAVSPDLEYLLKYMEKRFDSMEERFAHLEGRFDELQGAVDAYAKRADAYFQEMVALSHKVERHERWLHQIAEKLGVKLEY
jgi:uncharacterized coiled-coil protein SlyX